MGFMKRTAATAALLSTLFAPVDFIRPREAEANPHYRPGVVWPVIVPAHGYHPRFWRGGYSFFANIQIGDPYSERVVVVRETPAVVIREVQQPVYQQPVPTGPSISLEDLRKERREAREEGREIEKYRADAEHHKRRAEEAERKIEETQKQLAEYRSKFDEQGKQLDALTKQIAELQKPGFFEKLIGAVKPKEAEAVPARKYAFQDRYSTICRSQYDDEAIRYMETFAEAAGRDDLKPYDTNDGFVVYRNRRGDSVLRVKLPTEKKISQAKFRGYLSNELIKSGIFPDSVLNRIEIKPSDYACRG